MANWVLKGLATQVVTTRYPFRREDDIPGACSFTPSVTKDQCLSTCAECAEVCPTGAIRKSLLSPDAPEIDYARCIFCRQCAEVCPKRIISLSKRFELSSLNDGGGILKEAGTANKVRRLFRRSLHIRHMDAGSCEACLSEISALSSPYYDLNRLGFFFTNSPRHADVLLVSGPVTKNLEQSLQKTYEAIPEPKMVIGAGTCAAGGWMAGQNYACRKRLDSLLPVDLVIPGCPPSPLTLLHGLLLALGRVTK
uniref:4Fe-4S ferredoxin n=1 Tax=Ammonifex degensii TaxID=42838 RepID=A0A7C2IFY8_9THEO